MVLQYLTSGEEHRTTSGQFERRAGFRINPDEDSEQASEMGMMPMNSLGNDFKIVTE